MPWPLELQILDAITANRSPHMNQNILNKATTTLQLRTKDIWSASARLRLICRRSNMATPT